MPSGSFDFHIVDLNFSLDHQPELSEWLYQVIASENFESGNLDFTFMSDEDLLKINKEHLDHDFYTDIITFEYTEGKMISGDLLISLDRVKENATKLSLNFSDELHRVMVHGVLHLCGYNDKTEAEQVEMRSKEDYYLSLRSF